MNKASPRTQSQRTQITLPEKLREQIEQARRHSGESMAEYMRKATKDRLRLEQKKKVDLNELANRVIGAVKNSKETRQDVVRWQRAIRRSRR